MFTDKYGPYNFDPACPPAIDWLDGATHIDPQLLLQCLVDLQQRFGFIPLFYQELLSEKTGLTETEIRGVIDFFHLLEPDTTAPWVIHVSTNITDFMLGQQDNLDTLEAFEKEHPGLIKVFRTSCTGLCDQGPAILVNGFEMNEVSNERLSAILNAIERNTSLADWPQEWFSIENNIRLSDALLDHAIKPGGPLSKVSTMGGDKFLKQLEKSGLKGRGGAGFPTAIKWKACIDAPGKEKVIVCNADEGEPGTFKDRVLLTTKLDNVLEGMSICAKVIGATQGFIYLRKEYLYLYDFIKDTMQAHTDKGLLPNGFSLDVQIGAGAYICGEESAMLDSMEGKRGIPRIRPPLPVQEGFQAKPTVVNNVETFCNVTFLADKGLNEFRPATQDTASGTKIHSISGDVATPGIYEFPLGTTIKTILEACGGEDAGWVQIGGAAGYMLCAGNFDVAIDYVHLSSAGALMVFSKERSLHDILNNFANFFADESCGFCTPCRGGTQMLRHYSESILTGDLRESDMQHALSLCQMMQAASHCGLGKTAGAAIEQILTDHIVPEISYPQVIAHD